MPGRQPPYFKADDNFVVDRHHDGSTSTRFTGHILLLAIAACTLDLLCSGTTKAPTDRHTLITTRSKT